MFDFLLVTLTLTSPFLIIVLVRHYFKYKTQVNQQLAQLQQQADINTVSGMQKKLEVVVQRVIVLEKIVTDKKFDLRSEINQL